MIKPSLMSDFFGVRFNPHAWFKDFLKLVFKIYLIVRQSM